MAFISAEQQGFLRDKFAKDLTNTVNIACFTRREGPTVGPDQERLYFEETNQLLDELAALSEKINVTVFDSVADADRAKELDIDKTPAIILDSGAGDRVRYFGIPAGYEFGSLIEDIIDISRRTTRLSSTTWDTLQKLEDDVHIQVFVTPT